MFSSKYSEHESESSFDENEDNQIDNLNKLFKGIGLEPYQFEPTNFLILFASPPARYSNPPVYHFFEFVRSSFFSFTLTDIHARYYQIL